MKSLIFHLDGAGTFANDNSSSGKFKCHILSTAVFLLYLTLFFTVLLIFGDLMMSCLVSEDEKIDPQLARPSV